MMVEEGNSIGGLRTARVDDIMLISSRRDWAARHQLLFGRGGRFTTANGKRFEIDPPRLLRRVLLTVNKEPSATSTYLNQ
jgi:hypothetical protein